MDHTQRLTDIQNREKALNRIVAQVIKDIEQAIQSATGATKVWGHHFGATGIDPKHLFIYFVLPTRAEVSKFQKSKTWASIRSDLLHRLEINGYPTSSLQTDWAAIYSEQECKETCNGDWHYFFK